MTHSLRLSKNQRFLERSDGSPFFWMGDTAWELFHRLGRDDAERYLRNRADKGFSVIQAVVLAEQDGLKTPNANGDCPLEDLDPTRPSEAYFAHVDWVVEKANALGLTIGMVPTWGRYWSQNDHADQPVFTPDNAYEYGLFMGKRYAASDLVWILGGDRFIDSDAELAVIRRMAAGLREGDNGSHLITFHPCGPGRSSEQLHDEEWLDFNMCQTSHAAQAHDPGLSIAADCSLDPVKPTLDGEPRYEGIPIGFYNRGASPHLRFSDADVRAAAYLALLSGACGHTYGHNSVWQMWEPGRNPVIHADLPWFQALDHPGAFQMGYLSRLWRSRPFQELQSAPELPLDTLLVGPAKVRAALSEDRTWAMIYSTQGAPFTIDQGRFTCRELDALWFDPRTGALRHLHTGRNLAHQTFTPPTSGPGQDWLLVLEDKQRAFPRELFVR